jgi:aryl-alcohol dehydrogenase-like predicted oxidoreductase
MQCIAKGKCENGFWRIVGRRIAEMTIFGGVSSRLGLGCMSFAGAYGNTDQAEAHKTLAAAFELGVTHLDTSNVYGMGRSETIIGAFLKVNPHAFSIATKGGIVLGPERRFDNSPAHLRAELEGSLRRLGVEQVELYYVHRREVAREIEEVTETLAAFVREGKIGGIGFSEIAPASLRRAAAVHPVMAVQSEYSLWSRQPELGMLQACAELGTSFVAFSPLGRGIFADPIVDVDGLGPSDFRRGNPRFMGEDFVQNKAFVERFNAYAKGQAIDPSTLALAWVLHQGAQIVAIPGTRTIEHLRRNVEAASMVLDAAQAAEIARILPVGWAHGARYSDAQMVGVEGYC